VPSAVDPDFPVSQTSFVKGGFSIGRQQRKIEFGPPANHRYPQIEQPNSDAFKRPAIDLGISINESAADNLISHHDNAIRKCNGKGDGNGVRLTHIRHV